MRASCTPRCCQWQPDSTRPLARQRPVAHISCGSDQSDSNQRPTIKAISPWPCPRNSSRLDTTPSSIVVGMQCASRLRRMASMRS
jgi:hypothetical protein